MKKILFFVSLLLLVTCTSKDKLCVLQGTLTGFDGQPMIRSDIQLFSNEPIRPVNVLKTYDVNDNGSFSIPISSKGFFKMRFCGVNHQPLEQTIYLNDNNEIRINVKLQPIEIQEEIETLKITGDFNNFSFGKDVVIMNKQEDHIFTANLKVSSDTLAYQILGADKNLHSINGQKSDYYVLDNGGDYISVMNTKGLNEVTIQYDLSLMSYPKTEASIEFDESNKIQKDIANILKDLELRQNRMFESYREYTKNGGDRGAFQYDWSSDSAELEDLWKNEENDIVKEIRYWAKFSIGEIDSSEAIEALEKIPPTSPVWSINTNVLSRLILETNREIEYLEYLNRLIADHPDATIKPAFLQLGMSIAQRNGEDDVLKELYDEFIDKYPNHYSMESVKSYYSPDRNIQAGKSVPDFTFISVDDTIKQISKNSLLGKIYLLDFWATWCGPCLGEMKYLHEAYEKYKSSGFEIISVSVDQSLEEVIKFRKGEWKLPWFNSYMKFSKENKVVKDFELTSIPKPLLINKEGKIIFTGGDIRGEKLDQTLSGLF